MTDELLRQATKRFEQAEVYRVESESQPVSFEANKLKEVMRRDQTGVALRVIEKGRIGLTSTTDANREGELVDRAGQLAQYGSEASFEFPGTSEIPEVDTYDSAVESISVKAMIDTGRELVERLREKWDGVLCDARVGRGTGRMTLGNSAGLDRAYRQSSYYAYVGAQLIRGTDMLNVWAGHSSASTFGNEVVEAILKTVNTALEHSKEIAKAPNGDVPVIFTPRGVGATLLDPLTAGFSGRNVSSGSSPLIDRWGEEIADRRFSLFDNPLRKLASGARPFDDEGIASRRLPLVERGVLGRPLTDLQTAGQTGMAQTGSAHRALAGSPSPGPSVLEIGEGDESLEGLFAGVKEGLVVEELLGAGQGNELGGDFRANVSLGYRVENGRIVGRVKNTMISGNVYKVLNSIEAISKEREWVFGSLLSPTMRCRGVQVAAGD